MFGQAAPYPWDFARPKRARKRFLECSFKSKGLSRELLPNATEGRQLPLDYMLEIMRDQSLDTRLRIDAAKAAAPYVHQKLSAISVDLATPDVTHEEWLKTLA